MNIRFGATLRRLRKERKMSLSDLSESTGIQLATLSRIENNKMTGSVKNHVKISKAFGLKPSQLFGEFEKDGIC